MRLIQKARGYHRAYRLLAHSSARLHIAIETDPAIRDAPAALREYALLEWTYLTSGGIDQDRIVRHGQACVAADPRFAPCYFELFVAWLGREPALVFNRFTVPPEAPAVLADVIRAAALTGNQQFREALALLSPHLDALPRDGSDLELAVLTALGGLHHRLSDWPAAATLRRRRFERAEQSGIWEDWFDAANGYAMALDSSGRTEDAQRLTARAIAAARQLDLPSRATAMLHRRGEAHSLAGEHDAAIAALTEAMDISSRVGMHNLHVLLDLARAYQRKGDLDAAQAEFERMLARSRVENRPGQAAFALRGLSNVASTRGDHFRAYRLGSESARIFKEHRADWQAGAGAGNLCDFAAELGDYDTAMKHCAEAIASAQRQQDPGETQRLLAAQGNLALQFGRHPEAIKLLDASLNLAPTTNLKPYEVSPLIALAQVHRKIGQAPAALRYAHRALQVARQSGAAATLAAALDEAGQSRLANAAFDAAEAAFREADGIAAHSGSDLIRRDAHRGLGQLARARGDLAAAARWLQSAVDAAESMRSRLLAPEHKAGFARENAALYEELIQVLGTGDLRALDIAERARARAFLDMLAESRVDLSAQLGPAGRKQRDTLQAELSKAHREDQDHPCERHRAQVAAAETKLAEWAIELRATHPAYANLAFPQPLGAAGIQQVARQERITILEFALGEPASFLWVVNPTGSRALTLPGRAAIEYAVRRLLRQLTRPPQSERSLDTFHQASASLYRMLFKDLPPRDLSGNLLIVPDGMLYYVPFEALLKGRNASGQPLYLNDAATIFYSPSVSVLAESKARPHATEPRRELLAFGAPAASGGTGSDPAAVVRSAYQRAGLRLAPLPNAQRELDALAAMFAPAARKVVSGWSATEEAFKSEPLDRYRRVHVASHAVMDENQPQRSGIVFSLSRRRRDEDGILRVNEIMNLKLNSDLVVISACQTGLGKMVRGEGMVGLTRALIYAGARRVGVSLWAVNDAGAAELMAAFYAGLRAGRPAAEALRAARRKVAREMGPAYRHPYFWAPFVLVGGN